MSTENLDQLIKSYELSRYMDAIALTRLPEVGAVAESLQMVKVPIARPGSEEVVIRLCASSMHVDEIYAAQGTALGRLYGPKTYGPKTASPKQPHILGSSVSGIVVAVGTSADKFLVIHSRQRCRRRSITI